MEGRAVSSNDEIEFINEDSFKDIENIFKDEFQ
jgi:hypothetical protein